MNEYPQQTTPPQFPQPGQAGYPLPQTPYPQQPGYPAGQFPQPGFATYPGQVQPGYLPPQLPRKSRMGMWMAIIIAVFLLGGGIVAYFVVQGQNSPTATLQQFCNAYKSLDAQGVYSTLSTQYGKQIGLANIQQSFNSLRTSGGTINCTVSNVQQNGSTASGTLTLTTTGTNQGQLPSKPWQATLVQENGQWKISNIA